ncbi:hypothetical protein [Streptomyces peucetius]|uniref:Tat pathway signal sequence domain protein n=1 Tax=Streptomyces peucetius TaxID=1950 RepID=A0ABY6I890_STRPE|nr:hypothetical protein [Streptomyces peucetius]UYQ62194.1 hypothetical protein OGH68_12345 [Streptomyces peucetius]
MNEDDMRLREALRREADTVPHGPAPVEEVLCRGRTARRRRTAGLAGTATAAAALLAFAAVGGPSPAREPAPPATAPPATVLPAPDPPAVSTVRPYRPVPLGHGHSMALLPDGRQNYVVGTGDIRASVEQARQYAGDSIRPNSLSSGLSTGAGHPLFQGAFRADSVPARMEVRLDSGERLPAPVLRLPGPVDWGAYYAFGDASHGIEGWTVTAYAADGSVLLEQRFGRFGR